jgi:hypothetical protein
MTAAGESDQRDEDKGADEIPTNSTRHAGENASNSVKDCSMMLYRPRAKDALTMTGIRKSGIRDQEIRRLRISFRHILIPDT